MGYLLIGPDQEFAADRRLLVAELPLSEGERLLVIPLAQAEWDVEVLHRLEAASTFGDLRADPRLWDAFETAWSQMDNDLTESVDEDVDAVTDDEPFVFDEWFLEVTDGWQPDPRLRTAETAPAWLMERFGRDETDGGMFYWPAPWLAMEDRDAIEAALVDAGYEVVHDEALALRYLG